MAVAAVRGSCCWRRRAWEGRLLLQEVIVAFFRQQQLLMNKEAASNHNCKCHGVRAFLTGEDFAYGCFAAAGEKELVKQSLPVHHLGLGFMDSSCTYWSFRFRTMEERLGTHLQQQLSHGYCSIRRLVTENSAEETEDDSSAEEDESEESESETSRSKQWPTGKLYPTSIRIREIKEHDYDDIMEREKKLKMAWRIKDLLVKQPQWSMTLLELGKNRDDIGFPRKKQFLSFLKRLPAIFQVEEDEDEDNARMLLLSTHFHLTPEAEALCKEECRIQEQMKPELVDKLRKLLMMSSSRQLALGKVAHLAQALGLPADFRKALVHQYPQYFRVVDSAEVTPEEGPVLELVQWNNELAITAADKKLQEMMSQSSSGAVPRLEIRLPKRYHLSNKDKWVVYKFHELEAPTPYEDSSKLHPASAEAEKRAVLTVQEVLSLTLEKRIVVDHLTHFRKEFKLSNQIRGMLLRHPEYFYVSRKGARETVFLRDAYEGIHRPGQRQERFLRDKHPLVLVKEKFAALMQVKRPIAPAMGAQIHVFGS